MYKEITRKQNPLHDWNCFSKVIDAFYIHTSNVSEFLQTLVNTYHIIFFYYSHSNECECVSHCGFNLHFPMLHGIDTFHILIGYHRSTLVRCLFRCIGHYLIGLLLTCKDTSPLPERWFTNIFFRFVAHLCHRKCRNF